MMDNTDLVIKLLDATKQGKIDWRPTAKTDEFTASFGGKWTLLCRQFATGSQIVERLSLQNAAGEELLSIRDSDISNVTRLYEMARRYALKVDEAIADLMKEIDEPQS
jgi:hypothetical protein